MNCKIGLMVAVLVGAVGLCTFASCSPSGPGNCVDANCDDGDPCTTDSCDPVTGSCLNQPIDCDDGDLCTDDSCDPASGCVNEARNCFDGDFCTEDSCDPASGCVTSPLDCDDGDLCTNDSCDPASGCVNDPVDCGDEDMCTSDICDPDTGGCSNDILDCDDADLCTVDSCDAAMGCVNDAVDCDDDDLCTSDDCDPASGCVNTPVVCDDGDACTSDSCDPETGGCISEPDLCLVEQTFNVEPDDYEDGTEIPQIIPQVTLNTTLDDGRIVTLFTVTASNDGQGLAPTGDQVFAHVNIPFFNSIRRLRMDFTSPAKMVQIAFGGGTFAQPETGILRVYDASDVLLEEYFTDPLIAEETEIMTITRVSADIAWAVAYSEGDGSFGRLDDLVFTIVTNDP